jgi:hypothetical protein
MQSLATVAGAGVSTAPGDAKIDALIALCMAVERAEHKPEPVLLGWI